MNIEFKYNQYKINLWYFINNLVDLRNKQRLCGGRDLIVHRWKVDQEHVHEYATGAGKMSLHSELSLVMPF